MSNRIHGRSGLARRRCSLLALALPIVSACESDSLRPPPVSPSQLYWEIDLNYHAVTLATVAPYDTLTLVATPRNLHGEVLPEFPATQFTSKDVERVRVAPNGTLQAVGQTTSSVWVTAKLTLGNLTHTDSVLVKVVNTATPPVLASLSVHPVPPDSAKLPSSAPDGEFEPLRLPVQVIDTGGIPIPDLPVYFRSSDPTIATINRVDGGIKGVRPGSVTIYASTTAFGITKADTLPYQVGLPLARVVSLRKVESLGGENFTYTFSPSEIKVGVGALVVFAALGTFTFTDTNYVDVVFSDVDLPNIVAADTWPLGDRLAKSVSSYCTIDPFFNPKAPDCSTQGNFFLSDTSSTVYSNAIALRVFTAPGTYEYHSTTHGFSGRIIVAHDH